MIENLCVNAEHINWFFDGAEIDIHIKNAFFASEDNNHHYVVVETGLNFVSSSLYYYDYQGNLILMYDIILGMVKWTYQSQNIEMFFENLIQVGFYPDLNRIVILSNPKEQEIKGYNLSGDKIFDSYPEKGYKPAYLTEFENSVLVVCDGDKQHEDSYGRFRKNFQLDLNSGRLELKGMAY